MISAEQFHQFTDAFMRLGLTREEAARRAWAKCLKQSAKGKR